MEYLLQLLIEKIENSENQWKPGANGWKSLSNKAGNLYDDRKLRQSGIGRRIFRHCINCTGKEWILISVQERN